MLNLKKPKELAKGTATAGITSAATAATLAGALAPKLAKKATIAAGVIGAGVKGIGNAMKARKQR